MDLAYRGTAFRGFAEQSDAVPTVGGALRESLEKVLQQSVQLTCAGRTDAGVHARGQVVSFDADLTGRDVSSIVRALNKMLSPEIVVRGLREMDADFNARFSARNRRYKYTVLNDPIADPLRYDTAWWVPQLLDCDEMNAAAALFVGEHDFGAFCRRPDSEASLVRRITYAEWSRTGNDLTFEIGANAFCHQMVRSIVGQLVEIGKGRRRVSDLPDVLESRDRSKAAPIAPPHGLVLWEVGY